MVEITTDRAMKCRECGGAFTARPIGKGVPQDRCRGCRQRESQRKYDATRAARRKGQTAAAPAAEAAPTRLADVASRIEEILGAQVAQASARVDAVRTALDGYMAAVQRDVMAGFLAHNGLAATRTKEADDAALAVLLAVESLPEIGSTRTMPQAAPKVAKARPAGAGARAIVISPPLTPEPVAQAVEATVIEAPATPVAAEAYVPYVAPAVAVAAQAPFHQLRALGKRLAIIGGIPDASQFGWAMEMLPEARWEGAYRTGWIKPVQSLEASVRGGHTGALVILNGFMAHSATEALTDAARTTGTPWVLAGRGGRAKLTEALTALEARLARKVA
jgi:hypothetical protein